MRTMTRLALLTAVALTYAGMGTAPALAVPAEPVAADAANPGTVLAGDQADPEEDGGPSTPGGSASEDEPSDGNASEDVTDTDEATDASTADDEAAEASVTVSPTSLTAEEFMLQGITVTAAGLEGSSAYTVQIIDSSGGIAASAQPLQSDADGSASVELHPDAGTEPVPGTHTVQVLDELGQFPDTATFEVTNEDTVEPELSLAQDRIGITELSSDGLAFNGTGFEPGTTVVASAGYTDSGTLYIEELAVDQNGEVSGLIHPADVEPVAGDAVLRIAESGEGPAVLAEAAFTIVEDDDGSEPGPEPILTIEPESIAAQDFVDAENGGVTISVNDCVPGEDAHFLITADDSEVVAFEDTQTLDELGRASVRVYGMDPSRPEVYIATYDVTVSCDGVQPQGGSFSVTGDGEGDGGDSGDGDSGDGQGSMPRTGAEISGLIAGAGLLLLGGALILVTTARSGKDTTYRI